MTYEHNGIEYEKVRDLYFNETLYKSVNKFTRWYGKYTSIKTHIFIIKGALDYRVEGVKKRYYGNINDFKPKTVAVMSDEQIERLSKKV